MRWGERGDTPLYSSYDEELRTRAAIERYSTISNAPGLRAGPQSRRIARKAHRLFCLLSTTITRGLAAETMIGASRSEEGGRLPQCSR